MNSMKVKQLSIFLQNKKGSLYDALETLSENDINIRALSLADTSDFGILRVVVDNPQKGEKVLGENYLVKTTDIVAIEMTDSPGGLSSVLKTIKENYPNEIAFGYSAKTGENAKEFLSYIKENTSSVFIGASGSGKSTIINYLLKKEKMKTKEVREYDFKGMHTTTHRELLILESGGVVIDTPGLRNLDLWEDDKGIKKTFKDLEELSKNCKFKNCTHQHEPDCYILELVEKNKIPYERYQAYITLLNENKQLQKTSIEIKKDRKNALKKITKYRNYYKKINKNLKK